jgi:hypothetical protein
MLYFVLEVIGVSILVSIFATWIRLIPRYPKKKYSLIQQLANTALLTVLITLVSSLGIYPSWAILFAIILFILWISVWLTNDLVRRSGESRAELPKIEINK